MDFDQRGTGARKVNGAPEHATRTSSGWLEGAPVRARGWFYACLAAASFLGGHLLVTALR